MVIFAHRKTGKRIQVPCFYDDFHDKIICYYLRRKFKSSDIPYIGPNWKYKKTL